MILMHTHRQTMRVRIALFSFGLKHAKIYIYFLTAISIMERMEVPIWSLIQVPTIEL